MGPQTSFQGVNIRDVNTAGAIEFVGVTTPQPGSAVTESLPNSNALCITLKTATTGPGGRGRVYLSGWSESMNDSTGQVVAAAATGANNFLGQLLSDVQAAFGGTTAWVVARRGHPAYTIPAINVPAVVSVGNNVVSFTNRDLTWDSQRRRVQ
jgi:hypothetical protein